MEIDLENLGTLAASAKGAERYRILLVAESAGLTAARLEQEPGFSGAGLVLAREVADASGRGDLDLAPHRAEIEKNLDGSAPAPPKIASFVVGFPPGGPGAPSVATGPVFDLPPRRLQLALQRADGSPMASRPFRLEVDGREVKDGGPFKTDAKGAVDVPVAFGAKTAKLTVDGRVYALDMAPLDPPSTVKGAQQRLHNLNYSPGPADGKPNARFAEALRRFQRDYDLPVDGEIDPDTCAKLQEVHGR